jgi:L-idonate 5-dehydrogenase
VQVGTLPDGTAIPANALLSRELKYVGSWRFANVFERVIEMVVSGRIDPRALITKIHPFENLPEAIVEAGAGENVLKMQIANPA